MAAVRAVVRGAVQGVGFRAHVLRAAASLGLRGAVWNRGDGAVELVASHPDTENLKQLEQVLLSGPGRVESVTVEPTEERFTEGFVVGPTR